MHTQPPGERAFGLSVGSACLGVAALSWWRGHPWMALAFLVAGTLLIGFGRLRPSALNVPSRVWWRFAQALGWINARILLTVFFAVVLTPVGLVMRMCGRNPLRASHAPGNWQPYPARRRDARHYEHLF